VIVISTLVITREQVDEARRIIDDTLSQLEREGVEV